MLAMNVYVTPYEKDNLKGLVSVSVNSDVKLNGIRIMESNSGKLFVSMPSYQNKDGEFVQYYHPVTKEFHDALEKKILDTYELACAGKKGNIEMDTEPTEITKLQITPMEKNNVKGLATVTINDCLALHSIRVLDGKYGLYPSMPAYKSSDGTYHDLIECSSKLKSSMKTEIQKSMKELKQKPEIKMKLTEREIEAVKYATMMEKLEPGKGKQFLNDFADMEAKRNKAGKSDVDDRKAAMNQSFSEILAKRKQLEEKKTEEQVKKEKKGARKSKTR